MEPIHTDMNAGHLSPDIEDFFQVREAIGRCFTIDSFHISGDTVRFSYTGMNMDFPGVKKIFHELGYRPFIRTYGKRNLCVLVRRGHKRKSAAEKKEAYLCWALFLATFLTTSYMGYRNAQQMVWMGFSTNVWFGAFSFSCSLLLILGSHELAHKWAAARNGIDATPPYFIPFPSLIGTMGAVIKIKSPTPDRNASIALGISGPLVGFLVTIPILVAGLFLTPVISASELQARMGNEPGTLYFMGNSLLYKMLSSFILHPAPDAVLYEHPLAIAGWAGVLVTGLNLIPMSQLDGGHIAHALLGDKIHKILSRSLVAALLAAGALGLLASLEVLGPLNKPISSYIWPGWLVWGIFGFFITRRGYPKTLDEMAPLRPYAWIWGVVGLIIFILCFMPNPIGVFDPGAL